MARPTTGRNGVKVTLYLNPENYKAAKKLFRAKGKSVSSVVDRLLVAELNRKRGIAHLHSRTMETAK